MRASWLNWIVVAALAAAALPAAAQCPVTTPVQGAVPPAQIFPASNWWNVDISSAPVDVNSTDYLEWIGLTDNLHPDFGGIDAGDYIYGIPYAIVDGSQDKLPVTFEVWDESDGVDMETEEGVPFYPIPVEAIDEAHWIEGGPPGTVDIRDDSDRHLIMVDCTNRHLYELYHVWYDETESQWHAYSGAFFDLDTNDRRPINWTSADASGMAIFPGLVRYDEAANPALTDLGHAIRMTTHDTNGYVFPASHNAGTGAGAPPLGARLRLKALVDGLDPALRTNDPIARRIMRTMQKYGMIIADNGSDMYFTGTFDTRWDNGTLNPAFNLLEASDFEVIQLGWQPPQSSLSVADVGLVEGNSGTQLMTFTATLSQASASTVTFNATSANGTATAGSDFVALNASGLSIPAGQLTKTFTVTINGDTAIEANETFLVNLGSVVGAGVGDGQAVGTITNDDGAKLSINNLWLAEGNSGTKTMTFTVSLSQTSGSAVTFTAATANSTATSGSDYTAKTTTGMTIPAGQLSTVFSVTTAGDLAIEANESFFVNLSAPTNATILDGQGQGTILNDDGVALSVGDVVITEGDAGTKLATFTVQLTKAAAVPVTYTIATANGTAIASSDYVAKTLTGETIPAGQISRTFSVVVNGENVIEADETFAVNLSAATGATILDNQGVGTISNDDTPTVSIADVQLAEGNSGTKVMTFTVLLSKAVGVPVTYNIATANATASAGSDYVAKALVGETIPAGQTSRTFTVTLNGDTTAEANEWFTATLSSVVGVTVADGQALGVLVNDEGPTLSVNDVGTSEGNLSGKIATFTVTLSQVAAVPVTFTATTANSTALSGYDYIASTQTNLTIPAGQISRTVEVVIYSDNVVEPNEYFKLNLSAATGATISKASGFMTLVNDDGPLLRVNDPVITEGNAGTKVLNFTVSLAPVANGPVTFDIATANGTAAAGTDYVANALVGETIAAGVGSKTFAVTLNGDTTVEANETIKVNLTNAVGATIYDSQGLGTVTNDD